MPRRASLDPAAQSLREIRLGDRTIVWRLRRASRRSIGFTIGAEGLSVAAPRHLAVGDIEAALHGKAGWVLRKLAEQRERGERLSAARIDWRDGAVLPFLGRPLRLTLDASAAAGATVLDGSDDGRDREGGEGGEGGADDAASAGSTAALRIGLSPSAPPAQVRDVVRRWLQSEARRLFAARCAHFAPLLGVHVRRLALTSARTRWGSASADGSVRLHWRLMHFAPPTIDYVVAHELAHLRHMDHGPQFWAAVRAVVPDLDAARRALRVQVLPPFE